MRVSTVVGLATAVAAATLTLVGRPGAGSSSSSVVTASVPTLSQEVALASTGTVRNLIKNSGFETPIVPNGGFLLFYKGQTFSNWTVVGATGNVGPCSGTYRARGFSFPAHTGKQWLDLTGISNTATGIAQTVNTTPGAQYTLSFWVGNVVDPSKYWGVTSTVDVLVNGTQTFSATNSLGTGQSKLVWEKFTTTVTATSSATTIAFMNHDPRTDNSNGLDDVSLMPR